MAVKIVPTCPFAHVDTITKSLVLTLQNSIHFMPPNLDMLKGQIALGLSVRASIHSFKTKDVVLKFHRWIPHQKVTDPFFKSGLSPFVELCPF